MGTVLQLLGGVSVLAGLVVAFGVVAGVLLGAGMVALTAGYIVEDPR